MYVQSEERAQNSIEKKSWRKGGGRERKNMSLGGKNKYNHNKQVQIFQ